jgi:pyruvate/2-oxoglutarate dehydrogenase complex dihydrolipoamide acyltransferase (E2) component
MWLGLNVSRQRPKYFGTFCFTDLSPLGTESLRPLFPATVTLYYGTISEDGAVVFRAAYDHRALDGATMARALTRLEQLLNGVVAAELR